MAECSSCVVCETTLCVTICILTSQESKDKKKRKEWKRKTKLKEVANSSFKMPLLHKSLVLTGHPQGFALPRPLQGTVSWCSAPQQDANIEACIFQGRGFPIWRCCFCFCLAASWLAASQAVRSTLYQELPTEEGGFKWTWDAGVEMPSKGPPGRNALRKGMPASSLSSDTQIRPLAFTCCLMEECSIPEH